MFKIISSEDVVCYFIAVPLPQQGASQQISQKLLKKQLYAKTATKEHFYKLYIYTTSKSVTTNISLNKSGIYAVLSLFTDSLLRTNRMT